MPCAKMQTRLGLRIVSKSIMLPMTTTEEALLGSLRELEQVARQSGPGKPSILPILERLDRLASQLSADAPADLRHYLQRKSYEKARLFLEGRSGENARGTCGR